MRITEEKTQLVVTCDRTENCIRRGIVFLKPPKLSFGAKMGKGSYGTPTFTKPVPIDRSHFYLYYFIIRTYLGSIDH